MRKNTPRGDARPARLFGVERRAAVFDPPVEARLGEDRVQPPIEGAARPSSDLLRRYPQFFLRFAPSPAQRHRLSSMTTFVRTRPSYLTYTPLGFRLRNPRHVFNRLLAGPATAKSSGRLTNSVGGGRPAFRQTYASDHRLNAASWRKQNDCSCGRIAVARACTMRSAAAGRRGRRWAVARVPVHREHQPARRSRRHRTTRSAEGNGDKGGLSDSR
jgi:hypothetical protein